MMPLASDAVQLSPRFSFNPLDVNSSVRSFRMKGVNPVVYDDVKEAGDD
jgi:hypothetical protein